CRGAPVRANPVRPPHPTPSDRPTRSRPGLPNRCPTSVGTLALPGRLDEDLAQVDRLARLDGELLAGRNPAVTVGDEDPIRRARDEVGQGDPAVGVGD